MAPGAQPLSAKDRLILAVDTPDLDEARRTIDELSDFVGVFKVGLELFVSNGPAALRLVHERGLKLFFDCKLLDIPNTVAKASEVNGRSGVHMFTVHATGGGKMLQACAEASAKAAIERGLQAPLVLGVTVLSSLDQAILNSELNVPGTVSEQVLALTHLCKESGVKGIVCSGQEVAKLRTVFGAELTLVTPGVRPAGGHANDQSRVVTPGQALRDGADYLVVGRPITASTDRRAAAQRILNEMDEALRAVNR